MNQLGIVIYTADSESVWNAFRLGIFACQQGDEVQVFLLGKGVEAEQLDTSAFAVQQSMQDFVQAGGEILACGTCLKIRQLGASEICPVSTMADLYQLIHAVDKVLTF